MVEQKQWRHCVQNARGYTRLQQQYDHFLIHKCKKGLAVCLQWKGQFCIFFIVNKSREQAKGKVLVNQVLTAIVCIEKAWQISTIVVQKHIKKLKCCGEWHGSSLRWTWAL